ERGGRARDLDVLQLKHPQQIGLSAEPRIRGRKDIRRRSLRVSLEYGALALLIEILEELMPVVREVTEGHEQSRFLVIVVVAKRPHYPRQRGILPIPRTRCFTRRQRPLE